jgi:hypothetical protein
MGTMVDQNVLFEKIGVNLSIDDICNDYSVESAGLNLRVLKDDKTLKDMVLIESSS